MGTIKRKYTDKYKENTMDTSLSPTNTTNRTLSSSDTPDTIKAFISRAEKDVTCIETTVALLHAAGFITFPILPPDHPRNKTHYADKADNWGKIPAISKWNKLKLSKPNLNMFHYEYAPPTVTTSTNTPNQTQHSIQLPMNIGISLQPHQLVIDVDVTTPNKFNRKGKESLAHLDTVLGFSLMDYCSLVIKTPTGGYHLFFSKSPDMVFSKNHKDIPNLDLLSEQHYAIGMNSAHLNGGTYLPHQHYSSSLKKVVVKDVLCPLAVLPPKLVELYGEPKDVRAQRTKNQILPEGFDSNTIEQDTKLSRRKFVKRIKSATKDGVAMGARNNTAFLLFAAAHDLALTHNITLELMHKHFSPKCDPPLDEDELVTTMRNADTYTTTPYGSNTAQAEAYKLFPPVTTKETDTTPITEQEVSTPTPSLLKGAPLLTSNPCVSCDLPEAKWMAALDFQTAGGLIKLRPNTANNAAILLNHLPELRGTLAYDTFSNKMRLKNPPPWYTPSQRTRFNHITGELWSDFDTAQLRMFLSTYQFSDSIVDGYTTSITALEEAILYKASITQYNPVEELLLGYATKWDGVTRMDNWLHTILNTPDTPYYREVSQLIILSVVFRIFNPGIKYDYMVIFEGLGDIGKSTIWSYLAMQPTWFTDNIIDISDSKKVQEMLGGKVIAEFGEMCFNTKHSTEETKRFLSSQRDNARKAYARHATETLRSAVIVGTTNESYYLRDRTGNRRFLPIAVEIPPSEVQSTITSMHMLIPQLYGEAMHRYRAIRADWLKDHSYMYDYPLVLKSVEARELAKDIQESRLVVDDRVAQIIAFLNGGCDKDSAPDLTFTPEGTVLEITGQQIASHVFHLSTARYDRLQQTQVGRMMNDIGWSKVRKNVNGQRWFVYRRPNGVFIDNVVGINGQ